MRSCHPAAGASLVPIYHFHVKGDADAFIDETGAVCRDQAQAHAQALWVARETLLDALEDGRIPRRAVVEVTDRAGNPLFLVPLCLSLPSLSLSDLAARATRNRHGDQRR